MLYYTLDAIIKEQLARRRLPLHFYTEFMVHAIGCMRQLNFDTMRQVNTIELAVNDYYAVDLPADFVSLVSLGVKAGQFVKPVASKGGINRLKNTDPLGQPIPYGPGSVDTNGSTFWPIYWFWPNINNIGENTGRMFGYNTAAGDPNGYKIIPERGQIQLTETFTMGTVILEYLSDGLFADNATQVDPRCTDTIMSYIDWQMGPNAHMKDAPEARTFFHYKKKLRSMMSDLDLTEVRQILYGAYKGAPKN